MESREEIVIEPRWQRSQGQAILTVRDGRTAIYQDKLDLAKRNERERFVSELTAERPGIDAEAVRGELLKLAAQAPEGNGKRQREENLADVLVALTSEAKLFHDSKQTAYATLRVGDHVETWPVRSKAFRLWLRKRLRQEQDRAAYGEALTTAIEEIEAKALFDGEQIEAHVRVAARDGAIWLDLGDERWRAVKVTASGWEVHKGEPAVKFWRPRGLLPLPEPVTGGSVEKLRDFLNVGHDGDFVLLVAWLVGAMRPTGPFPVLCLYGEQGSAKSTAAKMLRALVDPNAAPLRTGPKDVQDLMISASNSWVLAYDNLSRIPPWLSDAFCRLSTGGGFATRELYTDREETILDVQRPLCVNGIEDLAHRSDLLDRTIAVTLQAIPEEGRRDEKTLWAQFEVALPGILGALLDGIVAGLAADGEVELPRKPRMADFALWVCGCEEGLGWRMGTFMEAYTRNRGEANETAIEASAVGPVILSLMDERACWEGTSKELLAEVERLADDATKHRSSWPKSSRKLSGDLRRIGPNLRALGIEVEDLGRKGKNGARIFRLGHTAATSSEGSGTECTEGPERIAGTLSEGQTDTGSQGQETGRM